MLKNFLKISGIVLAILGAEILNSSSLNGVLLLSSGGALILSGILLRVLFNEKMVRKDLLRKKDDLFRSIILDKYTELQLLSSRASRALSLFNIVAEMDSEGRDHKIHWDFINLLEQRKITPADIFNLEKICHLSNKKIHYSIFIEIFKKGVDFAWFSTLGTYLDHMTPDKIAVALEAHAKKLMPHAKPLFELVLNSYGNLDEITDLIATDIFIAEMSRGPSREDREGAHFREHVRTILAVAQKEPLLREKICGFICRLRPLVSDSGDKQRGLYETVGLFAQLFDNFENIVKREEIVLFMEGVADLVSEERISFIESAQMLKMLPTLVSQDANKALTILEEHSKHRKSLEDLTLELERQALIDELADELD